LRCRVSCPLDALISSVRVLPLAAADTRGGIGCEDLAVTVRIELGACFCSVLHAFCFAMPLEADASEASLPRGGLLPRGDLVWVCPGHQVQVSAECTQHHRKQDENDRYPLHQRWRDSLQTGGSSKQMSDGWTHRIFLSTRHPPWQGGRKALSYLSVIDRYPGPPTSHTIHCLNGNVLQSGQGDWPSLSEPTSCRPNGADDAASHYPRHANRPSSRHAHEIGDHHGEPQDQQRW